MVYSCLHAELLVNKLFTIVEYEIEGKLSNGRHIHLKIFDVASKDLDFVSTLLTYNRNEC